MQEDVRKEFLPLFSKPWWMMTWLTRIFGGLLLLTVFLAVLILPVVICKKPLLFAVVAILYYPALAVGLYRFYNYRKKIMNRVVSQIVVDDKGIHYERVDGTIDHILYTNLEKYDFPEGYDVTLSARNKRYVLTLNNKGSLVKVDFEGVDAGYRYYVGNLKALRRRFIQGVAYFRPDLKIDPFVFDEFCIHPETFTFDRKRYMKHVTQCAIIIGIILLISVVMMLIINKL